MRRPAAFFTIAFGLGAISLAPWVGARAQDNREEGPREIEKCQTIDKPGSYKLVNNLTFTGTTGACLPITASFVTIDLAGFTITGNDSAGASATQVTGGDGLGIAVRNGSNSGFGFGVNIGGESQIVEGLRVFGPAPIQNGVGITAGGIVRNNFVTGFAGLPSSNDTGILASGVVTGNFVVVGCPNGFAIGKGSTV